MLGVYVMAAAMLSTDKTLGPHYKVVYAICSRRDVPSFKKGFSLLGWRIQGGRAVRHPQTFNILMTSSGAIKPIKLASHIRLHIEMDVATGRVQFPSYLQRNLFGKVQPSYLDHVVDVKRALKNEQRYAPSSF